MSWLLPHERAFLDHGRRSRRRWTLFYGGIGVAIVALTAAVFVAALLAAERQAQAEREAWLAKRNEMGALAALSANAFSAGRPADALKLALAAWPRRTADGLAQIDPQARAHGDALSATREIARLDGHEGMVTSVAFSPDGARLATGSSDGTARLLDLATGRDIARLEGHEGGVASVAFSPDGARLAIGSWDSTARLWDIAEEREIARLDGHESSVQSVAFSPDGARLATGSRDGTARLWDLATGREIARLDRHGGTVTSAAFSPDGARLATGSWDGTARIWDLAALTKGDAFALACTRLPLVNGVRDTDLASALAGAGIEVAEPICDDAYDPPMPWRLTPGGVEPKPPATDRVSAIRRLVAEFPADLRRLLADLLP